MSRAYYYMENAERNGPHSIDEIKGRIGPLTFVWTDGMRDWQKARDVPDLASLFLPEAPAAFRPPAATAPYGEKQLEYVAADNSGMTLAIFVCILFSIGIIFNFVKDALYLMVF